MEEIKDRAAMQKTQIFNAILLDRSGSMQRIRQAAVDGFNEILAGIKKAQEKFADTQEHFVSLDTMEVAMSIRNARNFDYSSKRNTCFYAQRRHSACKFLFSSFSNEERDCFLCRSDVKGRTSKLLW